MVNSRNTNTIDLVSKIGIDLAFGLMPIYSKMIILSPAIEKRCTVSFVFGTVHFNVTALPLHFV